MVPKRFVKSHDFDGIAMIEPDFIDLDINISLCYNKTVKEDKGIMWLVELIEEIARNLNTKIPIIKHSKNVL